MCHIRSTAASHARAKGPLIYPEISLKSHCKRPAPPYHRGHVGHTKMSGSIRFPKARRVGSLLVPHLSLFSNTTFPLALSLSLDLAHTLSLALARPLPPPSLPLSFSHSNTLSLSHIHSHVSPIQTIVTAPPEATLLIRDSDACPLPPDFAPPEFWKQVYSPNLSPFFVTLKPRVE